MSPSRLWSGFRNLNLPPLHLIVVEFVQVRNILLVSSAEYVEFAIVCSGSMTPPSSRSTFGYIYPSADNFGSLGNRIG